MLRFLISLRLSPLALAIACSPGPIIWEDSTTVGVVEPREFIVFIKGETANPSLTLPPAALPTNPSLPVFPGLCPGTVQLTLSSTGTWYAAWWSLRPDSTADLVASSTHDGKAWEPPSPLDTADVAKVGCNRSQPGLATDGGNFYVVYSMRAKEAPGFFMSHSMDGGRTFHSPVAVVYGERLGLASVAANGNFVVVAFEDPNTTPTRVSVAVSNTMGHLFEFRSAVSPKDAAASRPDIRVAGRDVLLWWHRAGSDTTQRIKLRGVARGADK